MRQTAEQSECYQTGVFSKTAGVLGAKVKLCDQETDKRKTPDSTGATFEKSSPGMEATQGYFISYQNMGAKKGILAQKPANQSNKSTNDLEKAVCKVPKSG